MANMVLEGKSYAALRPMLVVVVFGVLSLAGLGGQGAAPADKGTLTAYSMVTRDGRRMVSWTKDGHTTYELMPTNQLPANLPPVREWKIYCVRSTHTDIGLHNSQYVQRHGSVTRTDLARKLVATEPNDADVAAFRYTLEGYWFFHNYPLDRGEDATRAMIANEMRRGRIGTTAACAGNHTHLYGYEELCRSIYTRKIYAEKWGLHPKTFLMADNPGISWSVVQPYAEAGVENVLFLPNQWNPLLSTIWPQNKKIPYANWNPDAGGGGNRIDVRWDSPLPMLFWWQAPDGVSKLLFWAGTQYTFGGLAFGVNNRKQKPSVKKMEEKLPRQLAKMDARYPYDVWLFANYSDDEKPSTWVSDLFKRWNAKWRWPEFRTIGNPDEAFDAVRAKWGEQIPVLSGEIVSGWLQHAVSTPELLARKQVADRALAATEAEASIAAAMKGVPYPAEDFRRAWWALILNDEHSYGTSGYKGRRVFETWLQHRDWIEKAERFNPDAVERVEAKSSSGVQENAWYKIVVNEKGEITSIYDKELGRELLNGVANRFLYTRDNHRTWEADPVQALGAELVQTVTLDPNEKKIYIDNAFSHARDLFNTKRYYRYGYYAFPFAVSNGVFQAQLNGPVMRPYQDLTGHSTDAYVGVRDWCAVENGDWGVALMQVDSSLVEFGEIHPDKTCYSFGKAPAGKSALYSYIFTDWLQMHNPDGESFNPRFRYVITSYKGSWKDGHLPAMVERTLNPRLASVAAAHVHADAPNVLLVALKAAEDGDGYIARFREAEGRTTRTKVVQTFLPGATVTQVGLLETPRAGMGTVPHELVLAPYAYGTVRITNGKKVVCAPPTTDGYVYTELVTRPRATHGEKEGQLYLEWGLDPSPDFDHFELWRDGAFVANVAPEVHDGLAYRVNRYEDLGLKKHTRYTYTIRPVYKDGRKGPYSAPFTGLTRQ